MTLSIHPRGDLLKKAALANSPAHPLHPNLAGDGSVLRAHQVQAMLLVMGSSTYPGLPALELTGPARIVNHCHVEGGLIPYQLLHMSQL